MKSVLFIYARYVTTKLPYNGTLPFLIFTQLDTIYFDLPRIVTSLCVQTRFKSECRCDILGWAIKDSSWFLYSRKICCLTKELVKKSKLPKASWFGVDFKRLFYQVRFVLLCCVFTDIFIDQKIIIIKSNEIM